MKSIYDYPFIQEYVNVGKIKYESKCRSTWFGYDKLNECYILIHKYYGLHPKVVLDYGDELEETL